MNAFSVALLVSLLGCALMTESFEKECCPYPFSPAGRVDTNVTIESFECNEPIVFTCHKHHRYDALAVLGDVRNPMKGNLEDNVVIQSTKTQILATAVCDTTARQWTLEGKFSAHSWFSCGVQLDDGTWINN